MRFFVALQIAPAPLCREKPTPALTDCVQSVTCCIGLQDLLPQFATPYFSQKADGSEPDRSPSAMPALGIHHKGIKRGSLHPEGTRCGRKKRVFCDNRSAVTCGSASLPDAIWRVVFYVALFRSPLLHQRFLAKHSDDCVHQTAVDRMDPFPTPDLANKVVNEHTGKSKQGNA